MFAFALPVVRRLTSVEKVTSWVHSIPLASR